MAWPSLWRRLPSRGRCSPLSWRGVHARPVAHRPKPCHAWPPRQAWSRLANPCRALPRLAKRKRCHASASLDTPPPRLSIRSSDLATPSARSHDLRRAFDSNRARWRPPLAVLGESPRLTSRGAPPTTPRYGGCSGRRRTRPSAHTRIVRRSTLRSGTRRCGRPSTLGSRPS